VDASEYEFESLHDLCSSLTNGYHFHRFKIKHNSSTLGLKHAENDIREETNKPDCLAIQVQK
jgi:hypothetical protein